MIALKTQVDRTQIALEDDEVLNMNIQRFSSYLNYFMEQQREQKTVLREGYERQSQTLNQQKTELEGEVKQARLQYSEVLQKLDQQMKAKEEKQEELGEAHEVISDLQQEMNTMQEAHLQEQSS